MKTIAVILAAALLHIPALARDETRLIGHFSNMVMSGGEDPHFESGYDLDLYRKDKRIFGRVVIANGSIEPGMADLQDVAFDESTGRLSFKARYSDGWEVSPRTGPKGREARTVLTFTGTVGPRSVTGEMAARDGYCNDCKPVVKKVVLKKTRDTYVPD